MFKDPRKHPFSLPVLSILLISSSANHFVLNNLTISCWHFSKTNTAIGNRLPKHNCNPQLFLDWTERHEEFRVQCPVVNYADTQVPAFFTSVKVYSPATRTRKRLDMRLKLTETGRGKSVNIPRHFLAIDLWSKIITAASGLLFRRSSSNKTPFENKRAINLNSRALGYRLIAL